MYHCLAQICLLGRGFDIEGWMDILVLVVLGAVYVLGTIIKAATKSKKAQEQQAKEEQAKSQDKPSKGGRGLFEQFISEVKKAAEEAKSEVKSATESIQSGQTLAEKKARAQAILQKYTDKIQQKAPVETKIAPAKPKASKPKRQAPIGLGKSTIFDEGIQALPDISTKVAGLPGKGKVTPAEVIESIHLSEVLADYEDPDELKRAILHYEILGRPLALRDPSAHIIGL